MDSTVKDISYYGLDVEIGKQFLEALKNVAKMAAMLDVYRLKEKFRSLLGQSKEKFNENMFLKVMSYFTKSYTFVRLTNEVEGEFSKLEKLCINDPAIFWELYEEDIDMKNQDVLSTAQGFLLEHIVGSHLKRMRGVELSFYNDGERDIDFILRLMGMTFLIQVAKSDSEAHKDLKKAKSVAENLKLENAYNVSLIMNAEKIIKNDDGVIVPASLFLALI